MRYFLTAFLIVFVVSSVAMQGEEKKPPKRNKLETLVFGVHPYLSDIDLKTRYAPLLKNLEKKLDIKFKLVIARNYSEHIKAIGLGQIDFGFIDPAAYVKLVDAYGSFPLVARLVTKQTSSVVGHVVVRNESDIRTLTDLKGKSLAFTDPFSTMGHYLPRYHLAQEGITLRDLRKFKFLGTHVNVAYGVLSGDFDAGAVKQEVFDAFKNQGLRLLSIRGEKKTAMIEKRKLRSIKATLAISEHLFVAKKNIDNDRLKAIKKIVFQLSKSARGLKVMKSLHPDLSGFATARDSDYDDLRHVISSVEQVEE